MKNRIKIILWLITNVTETFVYATIIIPVLTYILTGHTSILVWIEKKLKVPYTMEQKYNHWEAQFFGVFPIWGEYDEIVKKIGYEPIEIIYF